MLLVVRLGPVQDETPSDPVLSSLCLRAGCHCLEEVCTLWDMELSGGPAPEASFWNSYRWFHHRESRQRGHLLSAAQPPLDRYRWTTHGHLRPRSAGVIHRSASVLEEQGKVSHGDRIPFIRSRSEPRTGKDKDGSDGGLLSSITQRINRFLIQRPVLERGRREASCFF